MALDERIHRAVYRCAHNDLLAATLEQYYVLALRIWMIALDRAHELEDGRPRSTATLLEAILDGDGARAAATMRDACPGLRAGDAPRAPDRVRAV